MNGIKHLVPCRCILPQFKQRKKPINHQFVVFSEIDDENNVKKKYVQCPNCGIIHKVTEISRSEVQKGKEHMSSIITIDEIRQSLDQKLAALLDTNQADIATWEEVAFIIEHEEWGRHVVLNKDMDDDELHIKCLRVLSPSLFKVSNESRKEFI